MFKDPKTHYFAPRMPKVVKQHMITTMRNAPRGRCGNYCSEYMDKKRNEFPWETYGLKTPSLKDFSKWGIIVSKDGENKIGRNRKREKRARDYNDDILYEITSRAIALIGKLRDSFAGSEVYEKLYKEYNEKYSIQQWDFFEILSAERKRHRNDDTGGKTYLYFPSPKTRPNAMKIGFTTGESEKRMNNSTKNTRTELPLLVSEYYGTRADERKTLFDFEPHSNKKCGNKEMIECDPLIAFEYFKKKVDEKGGKMYVKKDQLPISKHKTDKKKDTNDIFDMV